MATDLADHELVQVAGGAVLGLVAVAASIPIIGISANVASLLWYPRLEEPSIIKCCKGLSGR